ncbi:hypothetical protein KSX_56930 [Ktedonospora formicarum]|uniref:Uncharacterized protein n=1 Tax=Ktedonospora formicarum TaxID=2778364 RepID=A0A8J3MTU7_9CHLR|nr:hypothetical protein KSX_56930 [Ktedonospora formicarum]
MLCAVHPGQSTELRIGRNDAFESSEDIDQGTKSLYIAGEVLIQNRNIRSGKGAEILKRGIGIRHQNATMRTGESLRQLWQNDRSQIMVQRRKLL